MNCTLKPRFKRTVLSASIAAIGLAAAPFALADSTGGEIEIGVGNVTGGTGGFGTFSGYNDSNAYAIANGRLLRRSDGNDAGYFEIDARNLGLKSRSLSIGGGQQGNFGLRLNYSEITKIESDTYQTPYSGAGGSVFTQPAGLADAVNVVGLGTNGVAGFMRTYEVGTDRKVLGLNLTKALGSAWDIAFDIKRDNKDGTKLRGAMIQVGTGGSRGVVILPEVVDYTTDMVDARARYDGGKLQAQFGYSGSFFKNGANSMTWDNPFVAGANNANDTGRYALAPSNQFHQLNASGAYTFTQKTRLAGNLSVGRMTQNDPFLPYSTGGAPSATPSLDGKVDTTHASLKLTSQLMPALNLVAGYKYDDRANRTPVSVYNYITGDRDAGGTGTGTNALRRFNAPLSSTSHKAYADLDYSLSAYTKLKFGYDYHQVSHTYEPTTKDVEQTLKLGVKQKFTDTASGGLGYEYSDRNASTYNGAAPLAYTYTAGYLATLIAGGKTYPWLEAPPLRKYFLDDRKRNKLRAHVNLAPADSLDVYFGVDYREDKHPEAADGFGLSKVTSWAGNFDAALRFSNAVTGHAFATLEEYRTDQNGANISGAANITAVETNAITPTLRWTTSIRDRVYTMGIGVRVKPETRYELGADLIHASSNGATTFAAGSGVANGPLPDLITRRNRLELFGRYEVQKSLTVNLKYMYERFYSTDWGYDSPLTLTSVSSAQGGVLGTNQVSPKYNAHVIGLWGTYRF